MTDEIVPLTPELLALISHVSSRLEHADLIAAQAAAATVVRDSPTMLDIDVPDSVPQIPLEDGPIPVRALIYNGSDQLVGEILIWIRAGALIGLEQTWFTDAVPVEWPSPSNVRLP